MEKTDAGLSGLCIPEIAVYLTSVWNVDVRWKFSVCLSVCLSFLLSYEPRVRIKQI